jgi:prophage regulatory protein
MNHPKPATFDDLPDMALIQIRPLIGYGILPYSATTIWRKCRIDEFPKPIKVSRGITAWRVGDIRKHLADISGVKTYESGKKNSSLEGN